MYLDALLQVSDVDPFCLKELRHDVPENTQTNVSSVIISISVSALLLTLSCERIASSRH